MPAFNKSENEAVVGTGLTNGLNGFRGDESMGTLFEGLGQTLQNGLNAFDESTKVKIEMAADEAVNGPNGAVAMATPDAQGNFPAAAQGSLDSIAGLKAALDQGTISQVQFDTQVAMHAKRIRASVPPGYGPMVEQKMSAAVGSSTANQQRQTELAAIDEANRAKEAKLGEEAKNMREFLEGVENQKYLMSATTQAYFKKLTGGMEMKDFILNPDPAVFNNVKLAVMYARADETNAEAALSIAEKNQKLTGIQTSTIVGQVLGEVFSEKSKPYQDIIQAMNSAWADKKITPEETQNLTNLYRDFKYNASASLGTLLAGKNLSSEDRKNLAAEMETRMKGLELALSDPTFGLLNATNNYFNDRVTAAGQKAAERSKVLYDLAIMQKMGLPPQVISEHYAKMGGYADLSSALSDATADVATGSASIPDVLKKNKEALNDPAKMAKFTQGVFSGLTELLSNKNQTAEGVSAVAQNIFSQENESMMSLLPLDQRAAMFERMVSPDVVNKIIASGNQDTINLVQNWATKQFQAVSARAADNIIERQKYNYGVNFKFDGKQFSVEPREQTTEEFATNMLPGIMEGVYERKAVQGMQDINRYIRTMEPLWKADGLDVKTAMGMIMSENVNDISKEPTTLMMLRDALFSGDKVSDKSLSDLIVSPAGAALPGGEKPATNAELTNQATGKGAKVVYTNSGATRNRKVTPELEGKLGTAVEAVFGPGYTVQVFSGGQHKKGSGGKRTGSIRHDDHGHGGQAADVYIIGPDGKKVTDTKTLDKLKDYWLKNDMGSVGTYMRGAGIHLDEWTKEELLAGMASSWRY